MIWSSSFGALGRPLVIAHGGASSEAPSNTMAAFHAAVACADAIETDVRLTRDGVGVCLHDNVARVESGRAAPVGQISLAQLQRLLPTTPTLAEVCGLAPAIYLDTKERDPKRFVKALQIPEVTGQQGRFVAGVPTIEISLTLTTAYPDISQVALMSSPGDIKHFAIARPGNWVRLHEPDASTLRIAELKELGARVMITCGCGDRPVGYCDARSLGNVFALQPDAIVVNNPALARDVIARIRGAA